MAASGDNVAKKEGEKETNDEIHLLFSFLTNVWELQLSFRRVSFLLTIFRDTDREEGESGRRRERAGGAPDLRPKVDSAIGS